MGRTILIVDDHAEFRMLARTLLEQEGFVVAGEAWDVASAFAAASALRPDVVLLDVHLPDGDGCNIAGRLGQANGALVVLTSTRDRSSFGPRLRASGARGFIPKDELSGRAFSELLKDSA